MIMSTCFIHACLIYTLLMLVWCFINAGLPVRRVRVTLGWVVLCKNELFKNGGVTKFSHIWQEVCPKIFFDFINV